MSDIDCSRVVELRGKRRVRVVHYGGLDALTVCWDLRKGSDFESTKTRGVNLTETVNCPACMKLAEWAKRVTGGLVLRPTEAAELLVVLGAPLSPVGPGLRRAVQELDRRQTSRRTSGGQP